MTKSLQNGDIEVEAPVPKRSGVALLSKLVLWACTAVVRADRECNGAVVVGRVGVVAGSGGSGVWMVRNQQWLGCSCGDVVAWVGGGVTAAAAASCHMLLIQ